MALSADASQGFEFIRHVGPGEIILLPGDPGDAIAKGDLLYQNNGVMDLAGDSEADFLAVAAAARTMSSGTSEGFPKLSAGTSPQPGSDSPNLVETTMIECKSLVPAGTPVFACTFKNHADDTVSAYTAGTPSITLTTALGADDDPNGALVYVYEGAGAGQWNVIADYANSSKIATLHRKFETALDGTSKVIILEGEGGGAVRGIGFFGRIDCADEDELDCSDGANDGDWLVYLDGREVAYWLSKLMLPVIKANSVL